MKTQFKKEIRYLVLKMSDIDKYVSNEELEALIKITEKINNGRIVDGKPPLDCVVVESEWPEYEATWKAIELRHQLKCALQTDDIHGAGLARQLEVIEELRAQVEAQKGLLRQWMEERANGGPFSASLLIETAAALREGE
jgi:hypothetical protein